MITYSLSPLGLVTLIFLLDFMGPCLTQHFGISLGISHELKTCTFGREGVDSSSPLLRIAWLL